MRFVVEFTLPHAVPTEKKQFIGRSSLGLWMVVGLDKKPKAIVRDYFIKNFSIVFQLEVIDKNLEELITTGEPDHTYIWMNPIAGMCDDPH